MPLLVVAVETRIRKLSQTLKMKCRNEMLRETTAEFLATFILTLLGNSVLATLTLTKAGPVSAVAGPLGWGLSLAIAIAVTGGVSGCHANPAVTLGLASVGKVPWKKVIPFAFAQYLGAFVSSIVVYAVYYEAIHNFDEGVRYLPPHEKATAQIFATYPNDGIGVYTALGDQIVSTMILMFAIVSITDPNNMAVPKGLYPLTIGLALSGVIFAFPLNCGAPLNPARDLGPRMFTAISGWGKQVFSFREYSYFWVPVVGPHIGAFLGAWIYRILVEQHWPVDSYDFGSPSEIKTNGEFKKKEDLPFAEKKRSTAIEIRKVDD